MKEFDPTHRRGFFGRVLGIAAAATALPFVGQNASAQSGGPDAWMANVKGSQRTLFDFPQHKGGLPQLHIFNYLNTYQSAYKMTPGQQVSAVGTFYGIGPSSSIPLAFNDAMWAKYALGEYLGLKDATGKAYTRNLFNRFTPADVHVAMQAMGNPNIPFFAGAMPMLGIENLQKMGTTFLICENALGGWVQELETRGKGKAADLEKELRANMLPGVVAVPAMVIAIDKAQAAGIRYNRQ